MKRLLPVLLFLMAASLLRAQMPVPKKPAVSEGLVLDYTGTLSSAEKNRLNQKLIAYDDSTSNQIAVVIIPDLKDLTNKSLVYPVEDVALQVLRTWGVGGQAQKDNGIVLLVAKNDRRVRIEVGYGLEGAIPDMTAASIIDHHIVPYFKNGDYYGGLEAGTNAIIEAAAGEYKAPADYAKRKGKGFDKSTLIIIAVIIFVLISMFSGGSKGGGYVSRRGYRGWLGPTWPGGGWIGGGGGGGGGGWSGGGGGFGGFGGGSGGGGGASGSW